MRRTGGVATGVVALVTVLCLSVAPASARVRNGNRLPPWAEAALAGATPRQRFSAALALAGSRQGIVEISIVDTVSGRRYDSGSARQPLRTASIIKVPIALALMARIEAERRGLTAAESADLSAMIRNSDNNAATRLWNEVGGSSVIALVRSLGGAHTAGPADGSSWGFSTATSADMATVLAALASGRVLNAADRGRVLDEMRSVTPSQRWGIAEAVHSSVAAVKNGWYPDMDMPTWRVHCLGVVARGAAPTRYALAVMTQYPIGLGQNYGQETCRLVASTVLPRTV